MWVCAVDKYRSIDPAVMSGLAAIAGKLGTPSAVAVRGSRSMTWQPMHQRSASAPPEAGLCAVAGSGANANTMASVALTQLRTCSSAPKMLTRRDRKSCGMVIVDDAARGGIAGALACAPVVVPAISMAYRQKDAEEFRARWLYCRPLRRPHYWRLSPRSRWGSWLVISDFVVQIYRCCLASSAIQVEHHVKYVPGACAQASKRSRRSDGSRAVRMSECPSLACLLSPHVSRSVT